jgi:hypothetical protein
MPIFGAPVRSNFTADFMKRCVYFGRRFEITQEPINVSRV